MKADRIFKVLLTVLALAYQVNGWAQPNATVQHYSTENGLSHITVSCMLKDSQGFMWFGTWDGINRFDGRNFISFKSFPGDDSPLQSHRIEQIVEGDSETLWVKAFDRQIYQFNKITGKFLPLAAVFLQQHKKFEFSSILKARNNQLWLRTFDNGLIFFPDAKQQRAAYYHYATSVKQPFNLPDKKINFFHPDAKGNIWIGTPKGVVCLAKGTNTFYALTTAKPVINAYVTDAEEDKDRLYFTTKDGLLYIFDKKTKRISHQQITNGELNHAMIARNKRLLYFTTKAGELIALDLNSSKLNTVARADQPLRSIHEDSNGNLWLEPAKTGVFRYNPETHLLKHYTQETDTKYKLSGNHFRVFEDDRKRVWINMKAGGFGYFDKQNDRVAYFFNNPADRDRKFSNNVISFLYDTAGVMWLASDEKGMEKIVFQENDFKQQQLVSPGRFRSDNDVRGMMMDRKQRLWVGAKSGTLYLIENGRKRTDFIVNMPQGGLGQVYNVRQDAAGAVWLGTKADGLYRLNPADAGENMYRLTHFTAKDSNPQSLVSNEIYTTVQDRYGRIWVGTYGKGLQVLIPSNGIYQFVAQQQFLPKLNPSTFNKVRQLTVDNNGRIWAATTDGLIVIEAGEDLNGSNFKTYNKQTGKVASLANNDVQYVYKDAEGGMWLATAGGGINKAVGKNPLQTLSFKNYTSKDGLANDYIVSISGDHDNNIWLASQNGLTRFNKASGHFRNFTSADGLPAVIFSEAACARAKGDSLLFGTSNGIISFTPARIKDHRIAAPLAFTSIQVNDEPLGDTNEGITVVRDSAGISELKLKYYQNVLNFDYGVLDYRSNDKQIYEYRLNGFDTTWHKNQGQPRATYTNLTPGKYVFEVRCVSNGLYKKLPYKRILVSIAPPPWRAWWAYVIYAAILAISFFFARRIFLTMMNLRNKVAIEQELAALKLQFFTNVSHELRTPLTLIVNPINALAESESFTDKGKRYLQTVQKNADRMVRFINQLLDLRKVESGTVTLNRSNIEIVAFIRHIAQYFDSVAEEKKINFQVVAPVDAITCSLDPDKFETVIFNILGNAFKFSPAGRSITVRIDIDTLQSMLMISVQDQAGGIQPEELNNIFQLFYEGSGHQGSKGTGIGLALAKEFVKLHGGQIRAENNEIGGLTVAIQLKLEVTDVPAQPVTPAANTEVEAVKRDVLTESDKTDKALVLLVEDHPELNEFLATQLGELYRVAVAENGQQGLQLARKLAPDLILSDVMMPIMDGLTMLQKLKADADTSHIPVVLLSAKHSVESQIAGLNHGADYYITKPFNNAFLLTTINAIISRRKQYFEGMLAPKKRPEINPSEISITTHDEQFLKKVIAMVEEKMSDADFRMPDLVSSMNMSRTAFYNKFKSLTNLTPVEFLREMRVKRGKQYLDAGETNISVVAYNVGFENARYFSSCFKDQYEITPTEYLKARVEKHHQD